MIFKPKIYTTLIGLFMSFLLLTSCNSKPISSVSENPLSSIPKNIKFIGHKGSGTISENGNINLRENTWKAIVNAMELIDGSEIDIQLSADSTFWIFHGHTLFNC